MNDVTAIGSSPRRIRLINVVAALQHLFSAGRISRAELARRLGLNRSSSGQIVSVLTDSGLVRETDTPDTSGRSAGRPGIMLELIPDAAFFTGIEIGVEHISAVTVDLAGNTCSQAKTAFDTPSASVDDAIRHALDLACEHMDDRMKARCKGVGVSAPMHIRPDGLVSVAPLIGWRNIQLVQHIQTALPFNVPIMIENDANAFAIGDGYKHSAAGVTLFMLIETGVGGGILIDGKLFRGGHGLAGEIGHVLVPGSGGFSLEQLIGQEVLIKRYRAESGDAEATLDDFLNAVRERDPSAVSIAEDWARHLGYTLSQVSRLIDPERIVLGGSVASLYPLVAARVNLHMGAKQAVEFPSTHQSVIFPAPEIVVDDDAEYGSAYGAACLLHQRFLSLANETLLAEQISSSRTNMASLNMLEKA